jgi:hypothetical protein
MLNSYCYPTKNESLSENKLTSRIVLKIKNLHCDYSTEIRRWAIVMFPALKQDHGCHSLEDDREVERVVT